MQLLRIRSGSQRLVLAGVVTVTAALGLARPAEAGQAQISASKSGERFNRVTAKIYRNNLGGGSSTNSSSVKYVRSLGCPSDDAGHIIANNLGGPGGRNSNNIFPQNFSLNRGVFAQYEAQVVGWLERKCGTKEERDRSRERFCPDDADPDDWEFTHAEIQVTFNYFDRERPNRPDAIHYRVTGVRRHHGNAVRSYTFQNRKPSVCPDTEQAAESLEMLKSVRHDVLAHLRTTKALRTATGEAVDELAGLICEQLDIEDRGDRASQTADRAAEQLKQNVGRRRASLQQEMRELERRLDDLESDEYVGDDAKTLSRRLSDDWRGLERVLTEDALRGRSSPRFMAKKTYNERKHDEWFRRHKCDAKTTRQFRGADCVSFTQCKVLEFAPPRSKKSQDQRDAQQHLRAVNDKLKDDERAEHCWQGSKRGFVAEVDHYPQCRPR